MRRSVVVSRELPAVRVGRGRLRIKREDFERLINDGYTGRAARPQSEV